MVISQPLTENVSKEFSPWTSFYLSLKHLKHASGWEKIFTWPSMTIPKFLTVKKTTLYKRFIDPMRAFFSRPSFAFIVPDNVANFYKSQMKDEKFTHLTCSSHFLNLITLSFLKNVSMSIFRWKFSIHVLISVIQQRIHKLHISVDEHHNN